MMALVVPSEATDERTRLRAAVQDACAHGDPPCPPCQAARVIAVVETTERERVEALREIKALAAEGGFHAEHIARRAALALDGCPRDTRLDSALTLLGRCHATLRRSKTPRPDPGLLREVADFLRATGIEVRDD